MQRKWSFIAVALVVLSAVSVFSVIELSDTGAETVTGEIITDTSNKVLYNVSVNTRGEFKIIINENYFEAIDSDYSVQWSYAVGNPSEVLVYTDFDVGDSVLTTNFTFEVSADNSSSEGSVGKYCLTIASDADTLDTLILKYVIDHKIHIDGTSNDRDLFTKPLFLIYKMALNGHKILPDYLGYKDSEDGSDGPAIHLVEGKPASFTPVIKNDETVLTNTEYDWYALGLPDGMAMTREGKIVGVPVKVSTSGAGTAEVYIQDRFDHSVMKKIQYYVMNDEVSNGVRYYLKNGAVSDGDTTADMVYEPSEFHTQRQSVASLSIVNSLGVEYAVEVLSANINEDGNYRKIINPDQTSVEIIDGDNQRRGSSVYVLPTEGTGLYRVNIYKVVESTNTFLDSFDLYVLSKVLAVESAIIIGSDSTS